MSTSLETTRFCLDLQEYVSHNTSSWWLIPIIFCYLCPDPRWNNIWCRFPFTAQYSILCFGCMLTHSGQHKWQSQWFKLRFACHCITCPCTPKPNSPSNSLPNCSISKFSGQVSNQWPRYALLLATQPPCVTCYDIPCESTQGDLDDWMECNAMRINNPQARKQLYS